MGKQANGVPASAKAGGAIAPGRVTPGAPPVASGSEPRARSRSRSATSGAATAEVAKPATSIRNVTLKSSRRPRKLKVAAADPEVEGAPRPGPPALSEEEQIGSAKYEPRELPRRVFEEERFIFPETYGANRVRLLVKDPHWLFAHWDVDPRVREKLRVEKGERVAALARLTLRLTDDYGGIGGAIVLPEGARSWYLRAIPGHRSYRVELGITLPSGEYRALARSNAVATPRMGPSSEKATRRASYRRASKEPPLTTAAETTPGPHAASRRKAAKGGSGTVAGPAGTAPGSAAEPTSGPEPGGASDLFRR
jgi:hypothetical protein